MFFQSSSECTHHGDYILVALENYINKILLSWHCFQTRVAEKIVSCNRANLTHVLKRGLAHPIEG